MCTLIALHRCLPDLPLVVAANRDEFLDRPSEPPELRAAPSGPVVAPRDAREGGSWLGVNRARVFAGITNRPAAVRRPDRRSRGLLLLDALARGSAAEAAEALERIPVGAYNPFNLLVADAGSAWVASYEDEIKVRPLDPGAHVIGNADPDDAGVPKVARLLGEARAAAGLPAGDVLDFLGGVCRRHGGLPRALDETCIHTPTYGTRSSTLLALGRDGAGDALYFADGAPCGAPYRDFTHLLRELGSDRVATGAAARNPS
jgi:uncharacterized protein with NRDE domain